MTKHVQFLELLIGPLANEGGGGTPAVLIDKNISANGTYNASDDNADGYKKAVVNVQPDLQSKSVSITENGTTNVAPDQDKDGLSGVAITVNVSGGGGGNVNDFAYMFLNHAYVGVLRDSTDQTVPRITQLLQYSMADNAGLTGIDLPSCTKVETSAVRNSTGLTFARLPAVTEIGQYNFTDAGELVEVDMPLLKTVGGNCLTGIQKLATVTFSSAVESISKNSMSAVSGLENYGLKVLHFPMLVSLGNNALNYLAGLNAFRASKASSGINFGSGILFRCTALDVVMFDKATGVVGASGSLLQYSKIANGTGRIYVPDDLVTAWKAATNWSTYASQIVGISSIPAYSGAGYNEGDVVTYNGHYYRCSSSTTSTPWTGPWDDTYWQDLGAV